MDFEWDELKRQGNIAKHRVDFIRAIAIFLGPTVTTEDSRFDYGEVRYRSIGLVGADCFVVVYTERDSILRIISAWKGGRRDQAYYDAHVARGDSKTL